MTSFVVMELPPSVIDDDAPARLLVAGDLHIGTRPRLPVSAGRAGGDEATPGAAWNALVERALAERVDAVLLAGDVVNDDNDVFLAGRIGDGVRRLVEADIDVLAVVGNHDARALPHLVASLPELRLVGEGATWESVLVRRGQRPVARVVGWSFPQRHHAASPLVGAPEWLRDGSFDDGVDVPVVGLLHCELTSGSGSYAPVPRAELEACRGVDAWLLGHEHHVTLDAGDARPIGYLGTLAPLDVTEVGPRGPWRVTAAPGGARTWQLEHLPTSWLRCELLEVDVADVAAPDELDRVLLAAVRQRHDEIVGDLGNTRLVMVRAVLVGRSPRHGAVRQRLLDYERDADLLATLSLDGVTWAFDDHAVRDRSRPALDVEALARLADPRGELARTLQLLEGDGPEAAAMVVIATQELAALAGRGTFASLERWGGRDGAERAAGIDGDVRTALIDAAHESLELLVDADVAEVAR